MMVIFRIPSVPSKIGTIELSAGRKVDDSFSNKQDGIKVSPQSRDRLIYGYGLPIVVLVVGMLFIANVDSSAGAAEFAGLAVFFMLLFALPTTLVVNFFLLTGVSDGGYFKRGIIVPCLFMIAALIYQSGLWDKFT